MSDIYYKQRNENNIDRMREVLEELPRFASEFFVGIAQKTSPLTRLNYAYDLRIFFEFLSLKKYNGSVQIDEITLLDIENLKAFDIEIYLEYLTNYIHNGKKYHCGESAKERKLCSLRSFFKYFYKKDKLKENITSKVDLPKQHEKAIIKLDVDEVVKILTLAEDGTQLNNKQKSFHQKTSIRDTAILTLFLGTGIRISECIGLDRDDFNFKNNTFTITRKGGSQSMLYFSDEVREAITNYLNYIDDQILRNTEFGTKIKDNNALFLSLQGKRISVRAVQNLVAKYSRIISPLKKITPHKLRSTYGTTLYQETQDIYVVADVLGHKDVNTTKKHYAAMSEDIRRSVSNVVKLRDKK